MKITSRDIKDNDASPSTTACIEYIMHFCPINYSNFALILSCILYSVEEEEEAFVENPVDKQEIMDALLEYIVEPKN